MKHWILVAMFAPALLASDADPVQWTLTSDVAKAAPGATVPLHLTAKLDAGWHLYSLTPTPNNTPIPTTVSFADAASVEFFSLYQPKPEKKLDPNIGYEIEMYTGEASL